VNLINETFINITGKVKGNSLKARSTRGATVLSVGIVIERILQLARNMILARILAPDAFGVMAIILTASTIFEALTDVGVR
jgi:O-antigen/teichoic acid export membrane protein